MAEALHPNYQALEQYMLGRLGPPDAPQVREIEEHLLVCKQCLIQAKNALEFAQAMRDALARNGARRALKRGGAQV